jgi:iron(III) transport system ATP-binding protein
MRAEIRRVCKEFNLTTVYVTHDQKEALSISDRMAIMEAGHILQVGSPREVYARPARKTVANFIGETNFIPGTITGVSGDSIAVETAVGPFTGVMGDASITPTVGAQVTVSIRPECWTLHLDQPGANAIKGTIGEAIYLGEVAQYEFGCAGTSIKIFELNPQFLGHSARGDLWASVQPHDVVVLTA